MEDNRENIESADEEKKDTHICHGSGGGCAAGLSAHGAGRGAGAGRDAAGNRSGGSAG